MIIDKFGCVIMEHSSWEGNRGDSAAETSRYAHLKMLLGDYKQNYNLKSFIVPGLGYIRHPELLDFKDNKGDSWSYDDFSSDQALPLYLAFRKECSCCVKGMQDRISDNWYRTGNGDLITPGLFAELKDSQVLRSTLLLGQQLIFKLPVRYNDEKQGFEPNENSVCDYLNYIHLAVYAPKKIRDMGPSKDKLLDAVYKYYQMELDYEFKTGVIDPERPIIAHEVCTLYTKVLDKYWE